MRPCMPTSLALPSGLSALLVVLASCPGFRTSTYFSFELSFSMQSYPGQEQELFKSYRVLKASGHLAIQCFTDKPNTTSSTTASTPNLGFCGKAWCCPQYQSLGQLRVARATALQTWIGKSGLFASQAGCMFWGAASPTPALHMHSLPSESRNHLTAGCKRVLDKKGSQSNQGAAPLP